MREIVNTLRELTERGVTVRSVHDGVDTSTSTGRMVAGILMSIAEYERELVRKRIALKLEHARKSGRKFGRPAKLSADQAALPGRSEAQRGNRHHLSDARNSPHHLLPLPGRKRRG
ncbi:MAG TPA: recombinase family protein, partial [Mycobacterium sp.]|nr:recombinase family protein [Mycobacterium sp.]